MKLLDSSVIVALFRIDDTCHQKAVEIFFRNDDFVVNDYVISEVLTVLKVKENFDLVQKCADFLTSTGKIEIYETQPELFWFAMSFFQKNKNKLSFTDTLLLLLSRENRIPLVTFDRELAKLAG